MVQIKIYQYDPVTLKAKRKYVSTGVYVASSQWKNNRVKNHTKVNKLNIQIGEKLNHIQKFVDEEGERFRFDKLDAYLKGKYRYSFNGFVVATLVGHNMSRHAHGQHMARHICAVMLLNNGMKLEVVSQWLGHSTPKITVETYAKVLDSTIENEYDTVLRNINK